MGKSSTLREWESLIVREWESAKLKHGKTHSGGGQPSQIQPKRVTFNNRKKEISSTKATKLVMLHYLTLTIVTITRHWKIEHSSLGNTPLENTRDCNSNPVQLNSNITSAVPSIGPK